jgi:hypothetical protein
MNSPKGINDIAQGSALGVNIDLNDCNPERVE